MNIMYYILIPLIFIVLKKRIQNLYNSIKENNRDSISGEVILLSLTLIAIVAEIYIIEL